MHSFKHNAVIDTRCTANTLRSDAPVTNVDTTAPPQYVGTPTGGTMKSSAAALIVHPQLPENAQQAHVYPDLKYKSLLLVGQLCDAGYTAVFTAEKVRIVPTQDVQITGTAAIIGKRNEQSDYLWVTDLGSATSNMETPHTTPVRAYIVSMHSGQYQT